MYIKYSYQLHQSEGYPFDGRIERIARFYLVRFINKTGSFTALLPQGHIAFFFFVCLLCKVMKLSLQHVKRMLNASYFF